VLAVEGRVPETVVDLWMVPRVGSAKEARLLALETDAALELELEDPRRGDGGGRGFCGRFEVDIDDRTGEEKRTATCQVEW
jgi:hypothetical protein